jgi:hypothetical protein
VDLEPTFGVSLVDLIENQTLRSGLYVFAGLSCLFAASKINRIAPSRLVLTETVLWLALSAMFLGLGIAKLFDIDRLLASHGREIAHAGGWYERRRAYQAVALGVVILVDVAVLVLAAQRRRWLLLTILLFEGIVLVGYAMIRTISHHHVDTLLYRRDIAGVQVSAILEVSLTFSAAVVGLLACVTRSMGKQNSP